MAIDRARLIASVQEVVAELAGIEKDSIRGTDRLRDDLGLDSLQEMELLSRLSEDYDIDPNLDDVMGVGTVDEVVSFLASYLETE